MSIRPDSWILEQGPKMIDPFCAEQISEGVISYGVSSYGYDFRVADEFKIFTAARAGVIDPKAFNQDVYVEHRGDTCIIPPNSHVLAKSVEYFRIPRDVLAICVGKSTYARCGVLVNITPFEPEWEGVVTLEIANQTPLPVRIYANEGIAQVLFLKADEVCDVSYADRKGKYQAQTGVVTPRVKRASECECDCGHADVYGHWHDADCPCKVSYV